MRLSANFFAASEVTLTAEQLTEGSGAKTSAMSRAAMSTKLATIGLLKPSGNISGNTPAIFPWRTASTSDIRESRAA